jgi:hypothetical protein
VIDLREEQQKHAYNSVRVNSESSSNELDEHESQKAKHREQRIRTRRGIVIDFREEQQ